MQYAETRTKLLCRFPKMNRAAFRQPHDFSGGNAGQHDCRVERQHLDFRRAARAEIQKDFRAALTDDENFTALGRDRNSL